MTHDEKFMKIALDCAKKALDKGEVPIGAVVVKNGEVISKGYNLREKRNSTTAHAEIIAIERACKKINDWRLSECEIYVTLEPCPMCAGAIYNARLSRVVYAARDKKAGACGSVYNLFAMQMENNNTRVKSGVLEDESLELLKTFFEGIRVKEK